MAMRNFTKELLRVGFVIQAGGLSTRMGTDKGLVLLRGKTLVAWILDQLDSIQTEKFIISNQPESYAQFGIPVFKDVVPGIGALGGLLTALTHAQNELVFVLACDMPFLDLPLMAQMLASADGYDVVIPRLGKPENTEPFRALYRKSCLVPVNQAVAHAKRRAISFFPDVRVNYFDLAEFSDSDPSTWSFFNINSVEDFARAELFADHFLPD